MPDQHLKGLSLLLAAALLLSIAVPAIARTQGTFSFQQPPAPINGAIRAGDKILIPVRVKCDAPGPKALRGAITFRMPGQVDVSATFNVGWTGEGSIGVGTARLPAAGAGTGRAVLVLVPEPILCEGNTLTHELEITIQPRQ